MNAAHAHACEALGLTRHHARQVWGYQGRTLSTPAGNQWLRLVSAPEKDAHGKLWDGPLTARDAIPATVPRPELHTVHDWTADGHSYRAELYAHATGSVISASPVLDGDPNLSDTWFKELLPTLDTLGAVPTDRVAVREEYIRRIVPEYTGHTVEDITWSTAHGDFHWANLTGPELTILDWEGWGTAPVGFDAATLYIFSLTAPATANRVRHALTCILDTPAGHLAELTVCAQVLQAADRTDFFSALAEPVRRHLQ